MEMKENDLVIRLPEKAIPPPGSLVPEKDPTIADSEKFAGQAIDEVTKAMARYSIASTHVDTAEFESSPAKALGEITVDDPNLNFTEEELKNPTDETLSLAIPLALAKAQVAEKENDLTKNGKRALEKFREGIVKLVGPKRLATGILLLATACSQTNRLTPDIRTATAASTSVPITETITPTSTPEVTVTPTVEPTEAIPENPKTFEGVGVISSIEQNPADGKWYGIDTLGRAEIIYNGKEWVKYDRPIKIAGPFEWDSDRPQDLLGDINQEEVFRLNNAGEPLQWGIVKEWHPFDGYTFGHVYVSGYPLGVFEISNPKNTARRVLLLEVPLRYQRQIIEFGLVDQPDSEMNLFLIPSSGDIQNLDLTKLQHKYILYHKLMNDLSNPELRGQQVVLAFQENELDVPEHLMGEMSPSVLAYYTKSDHELQRLRDALKDGLATDAVTGVSTIPSWVFVPDKFIK
ncbi:MAG: hypothetical protein AAGU17_03255 [Anaerolineaceae bacterium]|jgi:hypothetical protein